MNIDSSTVAIFVISAVAAVLAGRLWLARERISELTLRSRELRAALAALHAAPRTPAVREAAAEALRRWP